MEITSDTIRRRNSLALLPSLRREMNKGPDRTTLSLRCREIIRPSCGCKSWQALAVLTSAGDFLLVKRSLQSQHNIGKPRLLPASPSPHVLKHGDANHSRAPRTRHGPGRDFHHRRSGSLASFPSRSTVHSARAPLSSPSCQTALIKLSGCSTLPFLPPDFTCDWVQRHFWQTVGSSVKSADHNVRQPGSL